LASAGAATLIVPADEELMIALTTDVRVSLQEQSLAPPPSSQSDAAGRSSNQDERTAINVSEMFTSRF
jgi:hypothetical protein